MEIYTAQTISKCPYASHISAPPKVVHQSTFFVLSIIEKGEACIEFFSKDDSPSKTINVKENYCFFIYPYSPALYKSYSKNFSCRDIYLDEKTMMECSEFLEEGLYNKLLDLPFPPVFKLSPSSIIFLAECTTTLSGDKERQAT